MKKILAVLLAACTLTLVGCGGPGPGDRVKELTYAMEDGDYKTVKEIMPGVTRFGDDEKLQGSIKEQAIEIKQKGGIKSIKITEEKIDGDSATVKAKIEYGNGTSEDETSKLAKLDGKWIVSMDMGGDKSSEDTSDGGSGFGGF